MNLNNKVVWITGASSGIGKQLAHEMASCGARIILSSRRREVLNDVRAKLPGGESRHWVAPLDLEDVDMLIGQAQTYLDEIGPIDILVNNGGISQRSYFLETDFTVYQRMININYLGTVALSKAVLPGMVSRQSGTIVSISSVAGKVGSKLRTGYSGSKFAVVGFMDCLRAEVKQHGIECITICPGFVNTDIAKNSLNAKGERQEYNDKVIEEGMDVTDCCKKIIKAIETKQQEVIVANGVSRIAPIIKRLFPRLLSFIAAHKEFR